MTNPLEQISAVLESFATSQEKLFHIVDIVRASQGYVCVPVETIQQNAEDAAKYRNDGSTHAEGCYAWGPKHYECALRKLRDDAEDAKWLRALQRAMGELCTNCVEVSMRADKILREGEPHDQD